LSDLSFNLSDLGGKRNKYAYHSGIYVSIGSVISKTGYILSVFPIKVEFKIITIIIMCNDLYLLLQALST